VKLNDYLRDVPSVRVASAIMSEIGKFGPATRNLVKVEIGKKGSYVIPQDGK
jgi:hypothetical protein